MIGCQYVNNVNTERVIRREDRKTGQPSLSCDNFGLLCPADVELNIIDFSFHLLQLFYSPDLWETLKTRNIFPFSDERETPAIISHLSYWLFSCEL